MFNRWLERSRWRRSHLFDVAVEQALEELSATYGEKAMDQARRKAKRRHQQVRRKWVWREVVRRLDAAHLQQEVAQNTDATIFSPNMVER